MPLNKAILRTLAYADVFDYPLTPEEIHSFLIGQDARRKTQDDVKKELARKPSHVSPITYHDGFYCLKGRQGIVAVRKKRKKWSEEKLRMARRVGRWLRLVPWVRMVAVTGALAMKNSNENDDIDLLVVTARNRLWLTRFLVVLLVELTARRRRPRDQRVKDKICLNMFLGESHLCLPQEEQNLFTAHEVCQLKPLWSRDGIYEKFLGANGWAREYLPNALKTKELKNKRTKEQKSLSVSRVFSSLVDLFEFLAYRVQLVYMKPRRTTEITEPYRVRFHPQDCREWVLKEYRRRLKKLNLARSLV